MGITPSLLYESIKQIPTKELRAGLIWIRQNYTHKHKIFAVGLTMVIRVLIERNRKEFSDFWKELDVHHGGGWFSK
jgi:hypothetical protein